MNRKIDDLGRIVIPKEMRLQLGIETNDTLNFNVENNKIIITKEYDEFEEYLNTLFTHCEDEPTRELLQEIHRTYTKED